ncbi:MAG: hypothetical protein V3U90_02570 [Dehalococcoidia bacterium]
MVQSVILNVRRFLYSDEGPLLPLSELLPEEEQRLHNLILSHLEDPKVGLDDAEFWETAQKALEDARQKEPNEFLWTYFLGGIYALRNSGQSPELGLSKLAVGEVIPVEDAIKIFEKASLVKPDDPRPYYAIGTMLYPVFLSRFEELPEQKKAEQLKQNWSGFLGPIQLPKYLSQAGDFTQEEKMVW